MRRTPRKGFSLIELVISMGIGLIIAAGVMWMLTSQVQLTATQNRNIVNQERLRETLYFMTEEVRAMGSGVIEPYVSIATDVELEYVGDLDGDPLPDRVNYLIDETDLVRTVWNSNDGGLTWTEIGEDVLIDNVANGSFAYYAFGNAETDVVGDISSIDMALALDVSDGTAFNEGRVAQQSMVSRVTIRNRLPRME
jgi:prepilin-type N-terminal cleavage/methylation domain-containing protein